MKYEVLAARSMFRDYVLEVHAGNEDEAKIEALRRVKAMPAEHTLPDECIDEIRAVQLIEDTSEDVQQEEQPEEPNAEEASPAEQSRRPYEREFDMKVRVWHASADSRVLARCDVPDSQGGSTRVFAEGGTRAEALSRLFHYCSRVYNTPADADARPEPPAPMPRALGSVAAYMHQNCILDSSVHHYCWGHELPLPIPRSAQVFNLQKRSWHKSSSAGKKSAKGISSLYLYRYKKSRHVQPPQ